MTKDFDNNVVWQRCAGFLMVLGPGAAAAFYMSMVGFYFFNFKSPVFFIFMLFCLYLPYPLVPLVQQKFDKKFDDQSAARRMYFLRVIAMQFVLGLAVLGWTFLPQSPAYILVVGVLLGALNSVIVSSSFQMVSTLDPQLVVYAQLGQVVGGALPVAMFFFLNFDSDSPLREFRLVVAVVPIVCMLSAIFLSYIHFGTELFEKAYRRLSYDDDPVEDGAQRIISTESSGLLDPESAQDGVPSWVWCWVAGLGLMTAVGTCAFSTVSFCGCPFLTTRFALWKLGMDFVGRILAMPVDSILSFEGGPKHSAFTAAAVIHVLLGVFLLGFFQLKTLQDFHDNFHSMVFIWCVFHVIRNFTSSMVDVTTGLYVRVQDRKTVSRTSLMVVTTSALVGIVIALGIAARHGDLSGELPKWHQVIS